MSRLSISEICLVTADPEARAEGLLGWLSMTIAGSIRLDSIVLRRTRSGALALSFPVHTDQGGRRHPIIRPLDDEARVEIERVVFNSLGQEELEV